MISEKEIEATEAALSGMNDRDTRKLIRNFQKKQEPLLVYIAAVIEREGLNEEEQDLLTSTAILSWHVMRDHFPQLKTVPMEEIEASDNNLFSTLDRFDAMDDQEQLKYGAKVLEEHPQRELLGYISEKVSGNEEIREEARGLIFLIAKNILDMLIHASE